MVWILVASDPKAYNICLIYIDSWFINLSLFFTYNDIEWCTFRYKRWKQTERVFHIFLYRIEKLDNDAAHIKSFSQYNFFIINMHSLLSTHVDEVDDDRFIIAVCIIRW